jgi:hypothetical protein
LDADHPAKGVLFARRSTQFATIALSERPGVPFILATGYGEMPDDAQIKMSKLGKPFRQQDLAASIAAAVG